MSREEEAADHPEEVLQRTEDSQVGEEQMLTARIASILPNSRGRLERVISRRHSQDTESSGISS